MMASMPQETPNRIRTLLPTVICLALLGSAPCPAAEYAPPRMKTQLSGNKLQVEGSLSVPVSRSVAWTVLSDPGRFPQFVPGLKVSQVIDDRDNIKIVVQRGEFTSGPRLRYDGTVGLEERPGEGVRMRFLTGLFKDSEGEWKLSGDQPTTLTYRLLIDLNKSPMPPALASASMEHQVREWLAALSGEMQRCSTRTK